jgi:hypothetical protein
MAAQTPVTVTEATTLRQIAERQLTEMQRVAPPGQYEATVKVTLITPDKAKGAMLSPFDPFWSSIDDNARFDNSGVIDDKLKEKTVAIVSVPSLFEEVMKTNNKQFNISFLLRVPYSKEKAELKAVAPTNRVIIAFGDKTNLTEPSVVKPTANKGAPVVIPGKPPTNKPAA